MFNQMGPLEVTCDAPPYSIVRACDWLGFTTPEDVRWWRMEHFWEARASWQDILRRHFGVGGKSCTCGEDLPHLDMYAFTLSSGKEVTYLLGQCGRCRTMFWEIA
jgi:hypothetical protein